MASKKQLTGGTGDVNPQYYSGGITQSAANALTGLQFNTPNSQFARSAAKATVMEILKIFVNLPEPDVTAGATLTNFWRAIAFSTRSMATTADMRINNSSVFCHIAENDSSTFTTAGTGYQAHSEGILMWDLTDGAGHGWLLATDSFHVACQTANFNAAETFEFKVMYRFKTVGLAEYIGIVQSQQ